MQCAFQFACLRSLKWCFLFVMRFNSSSTNACMIVSLPQTVLIARFIMNPSNLAFFQATLISDRCNNKSVIFCCRSQVNRSRDLLHYALRNVLKGSVHECITSPCCLCKRPSDMNMLIHMASYFGRVQYPRDGFAVTYYKEQRYPFKFYLC